MIFISLILQRKYRELCRLVSNYEGGLWRSVGLCQALCESLLTAVGLHYCLLTRKMLAEGARPRGEGVRWFWFAHAFPQLWRASVKAPLWLHECSGCMLLLNDEYDLFNKKRQTFSMLKLIGCYLIRWKAIEFSWQNYSTRNNYWKNGQDV